MSLPLCIRCKYCEDIDVSGNVTCKRGHNGKIKIFCEDFEERQTRYLGGLLSHE